MLPDSTLHDIENLTPADETFCHAVSASLWGDQFLSEKKKRATSWDVYCISSVTSTMDVARWLCKDEARGLLLSRISAFSDPTVPRGRDQRSVVIISREQTRGRGRKGRVWQSVRDAGLYVNYLLFPQVPPRRLVGLSLVIGLAIRAALEGFGMHPKLKWPNDVLVTTSETSQYRKLGGILTELIPRDDGSFALSIGIGINVHNSAGLAEVGGISIEEAIVWELPFFDLFRAITEQVAAHTTKFFNSGFGQFSEEWKQASMMQDRAVRVSLEKGEYRGVVRGISEDGGLIIQRDGENEELVTVYAGDVQLTDASRN